MATKAKFSVGQVVWLEDYKRYACVHSVVYEGLSKRHHSYIVPAWNTRGAIQVHPCNMRHLTPTEARGCKREGSKR